MPAPRIAEKDLLNHAEMELFNLSQNPAELAQRTPTQLRDKIARVRNLRDRARDMFRSQVGRTRAATGTKRGFTGLANERTRQKAEVLNGVLATFVAARDKALA